MWKHSTELHGTVALYEFQIGKDRLAKVVGLTTIQLAQNEITSCPEKLPSRANPAG
jgi:hypothetical protein